MDTKSLKTKFPAEIMRAVTDALDLDSMLEMSNIPDSCTESAAASWLCVNRKPNVWVQIHMDEKTPDFKYDLRPGKEAA